MTRNPSAGTAAAIQPISDGSASTTCAARDRATAQVSTLAGNTAEVRARLRRRSSSPEAMDISSRTIASAQANQPGWPWAAATLWTWVKLAAPAAPPIASMITIWTPPSTRLVHRPASGSGTGEVVADHLPGPVHGDGWSASDGERDRWADGPGDAVRDRDERGPGAGRAPATAGAGRYLSPAAAGTVRQSHGSVRGGAPDADRPVRAAGYCCPPRRRGTVRARLAAAAHHATSPA